MYIENSPSDDPGNPGKLLKLMAADLGHITPRRWRAILDSNSVRCKETCPGTTWGCKLTVLLRRNDDPTVVQVDKVVCEAQSSVSPCPFSPEDPLHPQNVAIEGIITAVRAEGVTVARLDETQA